MYELCDCSRMIHLVHAAIVPESAFLAFSVSALFLMFFFSLEITISEHAQNCAGVGLRLFARWLL